MTRRRLLEWLARVIGAACAAVVGIPAVRYLIDPLRRHDSDVRDFKRVIRLDGLAVGVPREVAVRDLRHDAWTLYPEETIGRVWLVRKTDESAPADQAEIAAFASACPHLGCSIQLDSSNRRFVCPCHKAGFQWDGARVSDKELGHKNPAPREMDSLDCRVARDEVTQHWWVEVRFLKFKQGLTTKLPVT